MLNCLISQSACSHIFWSSTWPDPQLGLRSTDSRLTTTPPHPPHKIFYPSLGLSRWGKIANGLIAAAWGTLTCWLSPLYCKAGDTKICYINVITIPIIKWTRTQTCPFFSPPHSPNPGFPVPFLQLMNNNLFGRRIINDRSVCLLICECSFFVIQWANPNIAVVPHNHCGSTGKVEKVSFTPLHQWRWNLNKSAFFELQQMKGNGKCWVNNIAK